MIINGKLIQCNHRMASGCLLIIFFMFKQNTNIFQMNLTKKQFSLVSINRIGLLKINKFMEADKVESQPGCGIAFI